MKENTLFVEKRTAFLFEKLPLLAFDGDRGFFRAGFRL